MPLEPPSVTKKIFLNFDIIPHSAFGQLNKYHNYIVDIEVKDDKENSRNEALRIAKIVKNRLD